MKNKSLKKQVNKLLIISLLLTIGFPIGVFGIIFGATKGNTFLLVVGIILCVVGFYGMPIMWINYCNTKSKNKIITLVENGIYNVKDISQTTGKNVNTTINDIYYLLNNNYLNGYTFENKENLVPIKQKEKIIKTLKCPNCGAEIIFGEKIVYCEHCGSKLRYE